MIKFELSNKQLKNGRRPFKAVLYEVFSEDCIIGEEGTLYNENGITWIEKYSDMQLSSIKGMSITVEFTNDQRTEILGHGMTDIEDGIALFRNATTIGHCDEGHFEDIDFNGTIKRCCVASGTLDEMRYPDFIGVLEERINNGEIPLGSIEITHPVDSEHIEYLHGWKEKGRIPVRFEHSGFAIIAIKPADSSAVILELNSKNQKEDKIMDEKQIEKLVSDVKATIIETNSKNSEYEVKFTELNTSIETKEKEIAELNEKLEESKKEIEEKDAKMAETNELVEKMKAELNECKKDNAINELNQALLKFTEEEKKYAETEINSFNEDYTKVEINSIVMKINATIGEKIKEAQIAEINSAKEQPSIDDIFGGVDDVAGKEILDIDGIFA